MLSQYYIRNLCWRRFAIEGEGLPYGIILWGTFAIWYNFRGDNLPWYLFPHHEVCVGGRFTIEGKLYHMVLFPPWQKYKFYY